MTQYDNDSVFYYARSPLGPFNYIDADSVENVVSQVRQSFASKHKKSDVFVVREVNVWGSAERTEHAYHVEEQQSDGKSGGKKTGGRKKASK